MTPDREETIEHWSRSQDDGDVCEFPDDPNPAHIFTCYGCGTIWQWDEIAETWESIGEVEDAGIGEGK